MPAQPERLLSLQAARGVAALMVVIFHAARSLSLPQYYGSVALDGMFQFGHAGVDFFFVLSGFIITHVHYADLGRPDRLRRYAWRRFTRIFPIYWAVTLLYAVVGLASPDAAQRLSPPNLLESATLLPLGYETLVPVAWTLEHELLFYAVFGLAIVKRAWAAPLAALGVAAVAAGQIFPNALSWAGFLATPFHLQFLLGITVARGVALGRFRRPALAVGLGLVLFGLAAVLDVRGIIAVNQVTTALLYGIGSAAILAGLATAEAAGRLRFGHIAELFGGASYVLYLIHPLTVGLTVRAIAWSGAMAAMPPWSVVIVQVAVSLAVAVWIHRSVEQPLMMWVRQFERTILARRSARD